MPIELSASRTLRKIVRRVWLALAKPEKAENVFRCSRMRRVLRRVSRQLCLFELFQFSLKTIGGGS